MIRNILLKIKYDGTEFCGWQRQPDVPTVQGEVERVLSILCAEDIEINGTSRTDAGVHAFGQEASFLGEFAIPTENILRAANNLLNPAVQITEVTEMPLGFHARFDSKGKTYCYKIYNGREKNPFLRNYCYFVDRKLDFEAMNEAAKYIVGTHDFKCFQAAGGQERETTVRTVSSLKLSCNEGFDEGEQRTQNPLSQVGYDMDDNFVSEEDHTLKDDRWFTPKNIVMEITGDGFLYNMVRIITGTLVDVGLGKLKPEDVKDIISSCDRTRAGHTAPPQGLYLKEIYY